MTRNEVFLLSLQKVTPTEKNNLRTLESQQLLPCKFFPYAQPATVEHTCLENVLVSNHSQYTK
jgi:hypothetical protein